jgi:hypothetical protein
MEIEQIVLSDFIRSSYPNLKLEEIKLAFLMAIRKTFVVNLELYDKMFSCLYFANVINNYLAWKKEIVRNQKLQLQAQEEKKLLKTSPPTKEEIERTEDGHRLALEEIIQKENKLPVAWNWAKVYNSLKRNKLINDTPEEEKMFEDIALSLFEEGAKKNRIDKKLKIPVKVDFELVLQNELLTKEYIKKERIRIYYQTNNNELS